MTPWDGAVFTLLDGESAAQPGCWRAPAPPRRGLGRFVAGGDSETSSRRPSNTSRAGSVEEALAALAHATLFCRRAGRACCRCSTRGSRGPRGGRRRPFAALGVHPPPRRDARASARRCRQAALERSTLVAARSWPLLLPGRPPRRPRRRVGSRARVGGSVAHADPASAAAPPRSILAAAGEPHGRPGRPRWRGLAAGGDRGAAAPRGTAYRRRRARPHARRVCRRRCSRGEGQEPRPASRCLGDRSRAPRAEQALLRRRERRRSRERSPPKPSAARAAGRFLRGVSRRALVEAGRA